MTAALAALAATTAIEVAVLLAVLTRRGVGPGRVITVGIVANVVTHPALWWFVSRHDDDLTAYALAVAAAEIAVVGVEWAVLTIGLRREHLPPGELAAVAVLANAVTTAIGLAIALVG